MKNFINLLLRHTEHKQLYRRMIYTLMIMVIYIIGSNIEILSTANIDRKKDVFTTIGIAAMGGDYSTVSLFSLGLGPYLTSMLIINLLALRNADNMQLQTKRERQVREKVVTLILSFIQGYYLLNTFLKPGEERLHVMAMGMLVLIAGSMLLIWLADQNFMYGIAGPMPIIVMSIIKSIAHGNHTAAIHLKVVVWIVIILLLLLCAILLIIIERAEYRIYYIDILNVSKVQKNFLAWKLNPGGSLAIMLSMSIFIIIKSTVEMFIVMFTDKKLESIKFMDLTHPTGITLFILLLGVLAYLLSLLMLNPKKKAQDFKRSGNYIEGLRPGKPTSKYLMSKARGISLFSAIMIAIIIGLPFYFTLFVPALSKEIYLSIQILMLIYVSINIMDVVRNYMYFNRYESYMNKYW